MQYHVLGPLEVHDDCRITTPTAPKTASVLALFLLHANQLVLTDCLMEEIWGDDPPTSANTTLQTYIYQIRCALGRGTIETRPGGYCFAVEESVVDLLQFRAHVTCGQHLLRLNRPEEALDELYAGLVLWRGRPLSNVQIGSVLELDVQHLEEERRRAAELWVEASFSTGRHREIIGDLKLLTAEDPYNEWLHGRLIEALALSGRRRDALSAYASLRKSLAEHLGLEPMRELQELERKVLEC